MATWRELITREMDKHNDVWNPSLCTLTDIRLDEQFDDGYGGIEGRPFTLWTQQRIYFPVCYDGAEWVGSVARHPDLKPTDHQGGG